MPIRTTSSGLMAGILLAGAIVVSGCAPSFSGRYAPFGNGSPYYGAPLNGVPPFATLPINQPGGQFPIAWGPGTRPPLTPLPGGPGGLQPTPGTPTTPTIPVTNPVPQPQLPADVTAKWVPWPLPPRSAPIAQRLRSEQISSSTLGSGLLRTSATMPEQHSAERYAAADDGTLAGTTPLGTDDLRYHGGKTLPTLSYVNLYVGGESAGWTLTEVDQIEASLAAAVNDQHLNHVLMQYFNNQALVTNTRPPHPLVGQKPSIVSRGDIQHYLEHLSDSGYLNSYDLSSTIFNFVLPPGVTLSDAELPRNAAYASQSQPSTTDANASAAEDSTAGLAGYHGSVHHNNRTLYFSVVVYSQRNSDGSTNGIPVFDETWKNVCATLYHQMCEFRTDPDVEDALRDPANPASVKFLGWTSETGDEIGDYSLRAGDSLRDVFVEIPLANGNGTVPVQLMYSNAAHGPEGSVPSPHPPATP